MHGIYFSIYSYSMEFCYYVAASSTCNKKSFVLSMDPSIVRWDSVVVVFLTQLKKGEKNDDYYLSYFLTSFGMKTTSPHKSMNLYLIFGGVNRIKSRFIILNYNIFSLL